MSTEVSSQLSYLFPYDEKTFIKAIDLEYVFKFITSLIITSNSVDINTYDENYHFPQLYERYKINSVEKKENEITAESLAQFFEVTKQDDLNYRFLILSNFYGSSLHGRIWLEIRDESGEMYKYRVIIDAEIQN
jgi:hypothetical protein